MSNGKMCAIMTRKKGIIPMRNGNLLIDFHTHLPRYEGLPESTMEWFLTVYPSKESYRGLCDYFARPESLCAMLYKKGVDYAVLLAENNPVSGVVSNEKVANFCAGHPELIPFCSFDPLHTTDMAGQLRELATAGFKGVKLYPTYNFFYPNDPMMYPLYQTAEELGLPVMFHTGISVFKGSRLKYGDPIYYDDIAVDFPELTIVMSHGGRDCWYQTAMTLAKLHKNVYIDIAGLPPQKLLEYFPHLPRLANKFLFGTDWPSVDIGHNADLLGELPLSPEAIASIMGGNAKRLLKL